MHFYLFPIPWGQTPCVFRGASVRADMSWITLTTDMTSAANMVPDCVNIFLQLIISGELSGLPSQRTQRLLTSYGQDLIHGVSNGQIKTPKHILLPMAAKTLTGNAQLIQILNRLGHGLSYSQCEEIDTTLCLNKMSNIPEKNCCFT